MAPVFHDPICWLSYHYFGHPRAPRGGYSMFSIILFFPRSRHWPAGGQRAERCDHSAGTEAGTQHRLFTGPLTAGSDLETPWGLIGCRSQLCGCPKTGDGPQFNHMKMPGIIHLGLALTSYLQPIPQFWLFTCQTCWLDMIFV